MLGNLAVIHASLMMRTHALRHIGGYRLGGVGEDWDMFLRLGEVTQFANLAQCCYYYRVHGSNATLHHRRFTQYRIGYSCRCARARQQGLPEPTEDDYRRELVDAPLRSKLRRFLDGVSLARYWTGRALVLNGQPARGYLNLALSAITGPWRVMSRLRSIGFAANAGASAWGREVDPTPPAPASASLEERVTRTSLVQR
jgi:hypothetical protein